MQVLLTAAGFLVSFGGLAAAIGIMVKSPYVGRPLRWLWRTNVAHPVGEWNRGIVREVVDDRIDHLMHHRNGGSSLLDLADSVKVVKRRLDRIERHQNEVAAELQVFRRHSTEATRAVREDVTTLLEHDDERDAPGKRYDDDTDPPTEKEGP